MKIRHHIESYIEKGTKLSELTINGYNECNGEFTCTFLGLDGLTYDANFSSESETEAYFDLLRSLRNLSEIQDRIQNYLKLISYSKIGERGEVKLIINDKFITVALMNPGSYNLMIINMEDKTMKVGLRDQFILGSVISNLSLYLQHAFSDMY